MLISPKGGAQEFELIFPRLVEGKPLLEPGDKTISVELPAPAVGSLDRLGRIIVSSANTRAFAVFKVGKMMPNGTIAYLNIERHPPRRHWRAAIEELQPERRDRISFPTTTGS